MCWEYFFISYNSNYLIKTILDRDKSSSHFTIDIKTGFMYQFLDIKVHVSVSSHFIIVLNTCKNAVVSSLLQIFFVKSS